MRTFHELGPTVASGCLELHSAGLCAGDLGNSESGLSPTPGHHPPSPPFPVQAMLVWFEAGKFSRAPYLSLKISGLGTFLLSANPWRFWNYSGKQPLSSAFQLCGASPKATKALGLVEWTEQKKKQEQKKCIGYHFTTTFPPQSIFFL